MSACRERDNPLVNARVNWNQERGIEPLSALEYHDYGSVIPAALYVGDRGLRSTPRLGLTIPADVGKLLKHRI